MIVIPSSLYTIVRDIGGLITHALLFVINAVRHVENCCFDLQPERMNNTYLAMLLYIPHKYAH